VMPKVLMKTLARKRGGFMVFPDHLVRLLKAMVQLSRVPKLLHPAAFPLHLFKGVSQGAGRSRGLAAGIAGAYT
jgi:hypothetical protein